MSGTYESFIDWATGVLVDDQHVIVRVDQQGDIHTSTPVLRVEILVWIDYAHIFGYLQYEQRGTGTRTVKASGCTKDEFEDFMRDAVLAAWSKPWRKHDEILCFLNQDRDSDITVPIGHYYLVRQIGQLQGILQTLDNYGCLNRDVDEETATINRAVIGSVECSLREILKNAMRRMVQGNLFPAV